MGQDGGGTKSPRQNELDRTLVFAVSRLANSQDLLTLIRELEKGQIE